MDIGFCSIPIDRLVKAGWNYKTNNEELAEKLANNIKRNGQIENIIIRELQTGFYEVVNGNHRLDVLKSIGYSDVYCYNLGFITENQAKRIAIETNETKFSTDKGLLDDILKELQTDFDIDDLISTMPDEIMADIDIDGMLNNDEVSTESDNGFEPNEDSIKTSIASGDVIVIGKHRLVCGDCKDEKTLNKLIGKNKIDMIFTDPPYGLGGYGGRKKMDLQGDDFDLDKITEFYNLPIYGNVKEVYLWGNANNLLLNINKVPRDVIVWRKNNFGLGRGYRGQYELCFYYGEFSGSDSDVWDVSKDTDYQHPTQKPIELALRAIKNSEPKNNVLDIFAGSGSTMIACEKSGIMCLAMEIDNKYCQVIVNRMLFNFPEIEIYINDIKYIGEQNV